MANLIPYKGNDSYIFISYAHRDSALVLPIIERMYADGFRVWYDEGIDPGTEWDEFIAEHIDRCGYFIAFMSENYLASSNCKDELNYARDLEKNRLIVYLGDVALPKGMAMRINRLQSIFYHRYADKEKFYEVLYSANGIAEHRGTAVSAPSPRLSASSRKISYSMGEYEGEVADGKRHGHGIMRYKSGNVYEGEWKDDVMSGHGIYTFASGERYEGMFADGKYHGRGKYYYKSGSTYDGEYRDDKKNGYGVYTYASGARYEGMFSDGNFHGRGKYYYKNGSVYDGEWVNDKKHGHGTMYYADGTVYEGEWKDGEKATES